MKYCAVVLLVFLLITGMVSAVSISPVSVGAVKTIVTTPHLTKIPVSAEVKETIIFVNIDSTPQGAIVKIDGHAAADGITPFKKTLSPGTHTLVFSHDLYYDSALTLNLNAGMPPQYVTAELKRIAFTGVVRELPTDTALPQNPVPLSATGSFPPEQNGNLELNPGAARTVTIDHPVTILTLITTTTPVPRACPNSDWICLTPSEARQQFGYPNARYGDDPCGYARDSTRTVAKFCYMDIPSSGSLSPEVLQAIELKENDNIYIENATWIQHAVVKQSPGSGDGRSSAPWQPVFDFFNNFLGVSSKPGCGCSRSLEVVGFAAQP